MWRALFGSNWRDNCSPDLSHLLSPVYKTSSWEHWKEHKVESLIYISDTSCSAASAVPLWEPVAQLYEVWPHENFFFAQCAK